MKSKSIPFLLLLSFLSISYSLDVKDEKENLSELMEWTVKNGIKMPNIEIRNEKDFGRGIFATKDIQEGETVLYIPNQVVIDPRTAIDSIKDRFISLGSSPSDLNNLKSLSITNIMALFLIQQTELESSKWKPYIDALPTQFDTTIYWNEEELQELDGSLIKGSSVLFYLEFRALT
eukprot:TRINITY_DN4267_c0_g1_i2.p1 TRINITY_DN4267_c0_g1~~TRINITY_DN4267_c0_g1_i2.p1  ORF type:complete len:176 (+),score=52.90 TRINITY_DN4267_c0_g1_i2:29-556(+)